MAERSTAGRCNDVAGRHGIIGRVPGMNNYAYRV